MTWCNDNCVTKALIATLIGFAGAMQAGTVVSTDGDERSAIDVHGSGRVVSEARAVSGFHGVELASSGLVIVTQGDTEGLVIEAEDNIQPLLESKVGSDGILHLGFKPHHGHLEYKHDVVFRLAVKNLDSLVLAGSGRIEAAALTVDHPRIELLGSGEIALDNLHADAVAVAINGSGNVKLAGVARDQKTSLNGSGEYEAKNLKTDDASVTVSGSGEASVWAGKSLSAEVSGSGEIGYYGSPVLKQVISGSGEVHALGEKDS